MRDNYDFYEGVKNPYAAQLKKQIIINPDAETEDSTELYDRIIALWQQKNIKSDAQLAEVLNSHSIAFAYHSGKIENEHITYHDTREIFEHDWVTSYTGDLRTLFEIRNARDANEELLSAFNNRVPLDEALLRRFQFLLTQNTYDTRRWKLGERPGTYKKNDYVTGRFEIGALPEDVEEEMKELLGEVKEIPRGKILIAAAYFHVKFENSHPFANGNGRTGRLCMNYLLLMNDHPPIIIHEEDRREYYSALEAWDEGQDLAPMTKFLRQQTVKTWEKQVPRWEKKK